MNSDGDDIGHAMHVCTAFIPTNKKKILNLTVTTLLPWSNLTIKFDFCTDWFLMFSLHFFYLDQTMMIITELENNDYLGNSSLLQVLP